MIKKIVVLQIVGLFSVLSSSAQWTDHYCYRSTSYSGASGRTIMAGATVGFFLYDLDSYELRKVNKVSGLSDYGISKAIVTGQEVWVGYSNGNIDVYNIATGAVTNIPELKNKSVSVTQSINGFFVSSNTIYCATACGLLEINRSKNEIKSLYPMQAEGNKSCNAVAATSDSIFVAASDGFYKACRHDAILEYSGSWTAVSSGKNYSDAVLWASVPIVAEGGIGGANNIYRYNKGVMTKLLSVSGFKGMAVSEDGNYLLVSSTSGLSVYDGSMKVVTKLSNAATTNSGEEITIGFGRTVMRADGSLVIPDANNGLVYRDGEGNFTLICPNGPITNYVRRIIATKNGLYSVAGGLSSSRNNLNRTTMANYYDGDKWCGSKYPNTRDAINICYDRNAVDSIYISSWGNGIFKLSPDDGTFLEHYHAYNSQLVDIFGGNSYVRVDGITYDLNHNLIMSNQGVSEGFKVKMPDNKWSSLSYLPINGIHSTGDMFCDKDENIWTIIPNNNVCLFVFNTNGTIDDDSDDVYRSNYTLAEDPDQRNAGQLLLWDENREELTKYVYDMVQDKNGVTWFGTDMGVILLEDPQNIFSAQYPVFSRIKVPRNDGTNAADYLLGDDVVTAIAVDGANRKWIGTQGSGLYLVSEDGLEIIHSFNATNSPLPTNEITDIAINPQTGEVFVASPTGIISYAGDAIEPESKLSEVRVYPNPVSSGSGRAKITGLVDGTIIRIAQVSGRSVFETEALGGMATWNLADFHGNKVASGVYVVYAVNQDGSETACGKILVVK